jgi:SAM-dependent methyltransferase
MHVVKQMLRPGYRFARRGVHRLRDSILQSESAYRKYLRFRFGSHFPPASQPAQLSTYGALKSEQQWQRAFDESRTLGLPRHPDAPKNWDTLAAVAKVLAETTPDARVLDAGAELYSSFLPALYTYGYRHLTGINLAFKRTIQRGPIHYEPGDITATRFADKFFDAVACLSVIEHGVNLAAFFTEMARIIKPNGLLMLSTDYWETPVDTAGKQDFGAPIHVFSCRELESALLLAEERGFELAGPIDLHCVEKAVRWDYHGLKYTYVALSLRYTGQKKNQSADDRRTQMTLTS